MNFTCYNTLAMSDFFLLVVLVIFSNWFQIFVKSEIILITILLQYLLLFFFNQVAGTYQYLFSTSVSYCKVIRSNNLFSPKQKKKSIPTKNSWTRSHTLCLGAGVSSGGEE